MDKRRGPAIYWSILLGLIVGISMGIIAVKCDSVEWVERWIAPLGEIFVRVLALIAVPLLFISIVKAIINLGATAKLVSIGWRTIVTYTITTIIATIYATALVIVAKPGVGISDEASQRYFGEYEQAADSAIESASSFCGQSPLNVIVDMIPQNIITPLSGANMIQALVLAIFVALAIVTIKDNRLQAIRTIIDDIDDLLSHAIDMAMYIAPVGIMALMASVVVDSNGDVEVLRALGRYSLVVILGLVAFAYIFYPLVIKIFTKIKLTHYLKAIFPVQLVAFSTSSSAATLPTTMKVANNDLGIPKSVSSFTLPMGVTINMDGSSIYICVTVIFVAQVLNIDLSAAQVMTVVVTAVLASIGTPGVPGGVLLTVVMVFEAIGIPLECIALVIALIRPIDMFVTALNVTGDVVVSAVVAESQGGATESESLT